MIGCARAAIGHLSVNGPPGSRTFVYPADSMATIQSKLNSVTAGNSLVFTPGIYNFASTTITGKSGITIWSPGVATINSAPAAGTAGAFDFSSKSNWTIRGATTSSGFIFNTTLINATSASNFSIGNNIFNTIASNGFDGSAIRMNFATFGTVINNDFNTCLGNVLGMYNWDNITIDGNHFNACYQPISSQEPTTPNTSLGRNIIVQRNVFLLTNRACMEFGPSGTGSEYYSGLTVTNNFFDNFNNTSGASSMLPISCVGQSATNTTITNNWISRGPINAGLLSPAIEIAGDGVVSGNYIVNWGYGALTYQSGWNCHDNFIYSDGTTTYLGFVNNGAGTGTFGPETTLGSLPATPAWPTRIAW